MEGVAGSSLQRDIAALPSQLSVIRRQVELWVEACGLSDTLVEELVFSVNEEVTNAVEHAYPDEMGRVWIDAACLVGAVSVVVSDTGRACGSA